MREFITFDQHEAETAAKREAEQNPGWTRVGVVGFHEVIAVTGLCGGKPHVFTVHLDTSDMEIA